MPVKFQTAPVPLSDAHVALISNTPPPPTDSSPFSGNWNLGPFVIDYSVHFSDNFFDADIKLFGAKLATITLNADGSETASVILLGWAADVTLTVSFAGKKVSAAVTLQDANKLVFQKLFTLIQW